MIKAFQIIAEQRIAEAQKKGFFDCCEGKGRPIKIEDDNISPELRMAYKILKNSNCLPPEIELKKEITRTEELLKELHEERDIIKTQTKLNLLIKKYNMINKFSVGNEANEKYFPKLSKIMNKKAD
ncbi:MAG: DUF1992 domain-containing protein [Desulfobacteraceae bacterium]|nr:DUF1992 domain-containing protein [Desulfobacteraceae bacterium]